MAAIKNDKMGFNMNTTSAPSPEILETANAFVDDVIKEAEEIARKKKGSVEGNGQEEMSGLAAIIKRGSRWQNRARGIVTRIVGIWNGTFGPKRRNNSKGDK